MTHILLLLSAAAWAAAEGNFRAVDLAEAVRGLSRKPGPDVGKAQLVYQVLVVQIPLLKMACAMTRSTLALQMLMAQESCNSSDLHEAATERHCAGGL